MAGGGGGVGLGGEFLLPLIYLFYYFIVKNDKGVV